MMISTTVGGYEALILGQFEIFTFEVGYPTKMYVFTYQLLNYDIDIILV